MVADPEVMAALDEVERVLTSEGADVRDHSDAAAAGDGGGAAHHPARRKRGRSMPSGCASDPQDYTLPTRRKVMPGAFLYRGRLRAGAAMARRMIDAVDDAFRDVDVLLTASGMDAPFRIDDAARAGASTYPRQGRSPFNLTGHPAIAMMSGFETSGLPLSVQFVGRAHDEVTLLRVAAAYERATQWSRHRPPAEYKPPARATVATRRLEPRQTG